MELENFSCYTGREWGKTKSYGTGMKTSSLDPTPLLFLYFYNAVIKECDIFLNIYIYREREREREVHSQPFVPIP